MFLSTDATQVEINPLAVGHVPGEKSKGVYPLVADQLVVVLAVHWRGAVPSVARCSGPRCSPVPCTCVSLPVYAVDAKLNFDDNAAFRQQAIYALRDKSMEDARDVAAEEIGLNYIGLSGNIGCLGTQCRHAVSPHTHTYAHTCGHTLTWAVRAVCFRTVSRRLTCAV